MIKQDFIRKQIVENRTSTIEFKSNVELTEDVFNKAVTDLGLETYSAEGLNLYKINLKKAFDEGTIGADDIEKAKKDLSKLVKVTKIDKRGKKTSVWVKQGEKQKEQKDKKINEEGKEKEKPLNPKQMTWDSGYDEMRQDIKKYLKMGFPVRLIVHSLSNEYDDIQDRGTLHKIIQNMKERLEEEPKK